MNQPNKTHQDAQFPNPPYPYNPYNSDDEISLVDLAKILVRRKYTLLLTWLLIIALSVGYLLYNNSTSTYVTANDHVAFTTSISIGYKTPTVFIEPMPAIETLIQDVFLPVAQQKAELSGLIINVSYQERRSIQEDSSNILQLVTIASPDNQSSIETFHADIAQQLVERHQLIADQLSQQRFSNTNESEVLIIPTSLAKLAAPLPIESIPLSGPSSKLVLALGIVLGGMLGLISAFMAEFIGRVRESLVEDAGSVK